MTEIIEAVLNGMFIGFGTAIGAYFANKMTAHMIEKRLDEIKKIIKKVQ